MPVQYSSSKFNLQNTSVSDKLKNFPLYNTVYTLITFLLLQKAVLGMRLCVTEQRRISVLLRCCKEQLKILCLDIIC